MSQDLEKSEVPRLIALLGLAGVSTIFLLNFTFGGIIPLEIPDAIPIIGNLDEAAAAMLLYWSLERMLPILKRMAGKATPKPTDDAIDVDAEVVD